MASVLHGKLTLVAAARMIFATPHPTGEQVLRVRRWLESGTLAGEHTAPPQATWTTSAEHVAEFLASQTYRKTELHRAADPRRNPVLPIHSASNSGGGSAGGSAHIAQSCTARDVYQEILRDYFLTVFFRRRDRYASRIFRRCVLGGQIALVGAILFACVWTFRGGVGLTEEQRGIDAWIQEHNGEHETTHWFPARPDPVGGTRLRVQYTYYSEAGHPIQTDRMFRVHDHAVTPIDDEGDI